MSSLRLALKQSLQESGALSKKQSRSNRNRGDKSSGKRKKKRNNNGNGGSDSPRRKRGRPAKRRDSIDEENENADSSEEEEFDGEEESESDDEDEEEEGEEEEEDDEADEGEEEEDTQQSDEQLHRKQQRYYKEPPEATTTASADYNNNKGDQSAPSSRYNRHNDSEEEGEERSDEERRRRQRKLQKKLKNSAANKIQNQWKKKKEEHSNSNSNSANGDAAASAPEPDAAPHDNMEAFTKPESLQSRETEDTTQGEKDRGYAEGSSDSHVAAAAAAAADEEHHEEEQSELQQQPKKKKKKGKHKDKDKEKEKDDGNSNNNSNNTERGKGKTAKTVPPPAPEVLEWNRALPVKRARRNVAQGLRVKVRFATKVKREGKIVRKKRWFGGRVSAVSKEGSKIRIKYDDGTAEISKFPDKDVVVDDAFNGQHQANAAKFQPPEMDPDEGEHDLQQQDHEPGQQQQQQQQLKPAPETSAAEEVASSAKPSALPLKQEVSDVKLPPPPPKLAPLPPKEEETPTKEEQAPPRPKVKREPEPAIDSVDLTTNLFNDEPPRPPSPPVPSEEPVRPPSPPIPLTESQPAPREPDRPTPFVSLAPPPSPIAATQQHAVHNEQEQEPPKSRIPKEPPVSIPSTTSTTSPAVAAEKPENSPRKPDPEEKVAKPDPQPVEPTPSKQVDPPAASEPADVPNASETIRTEVGPPRLVSTSSSEAPRIRERAVQERPVSPPVVQEDVVKPPLEAVQKAKDPLPQEAAQNAPEDSASEPPAPAKPTLTIRLPNPKKEKRDKIVEPQKSPRIRIHKRMPPRDDHSTEKVDAASLSKQLEAAASSSQKAELSRSKPDQTDETENQPEANGKKRRRSSKEKLAPVVDDEVANAAGVAKKRRRVRDEEEEGEVRAPSSTRIHIHRSTPVSELSTKTPIQPEKREAKPTKKQKRPNSREGDDNEIAKVPEKDEVVDDSDSGPVRIVGRSSARRVPLFSDEESVAEVSKPSTNKEAEIPEKLIAPVVQKASEELDAKRPRPTKLPPSQPLGFESAAAGSGFQRDNEKVVVSSSRNSAFERKESKPKSDANDNPKEDVPHKAAQPTEAATRRPSTPRDKSLAAGSTPVVRSGRRAAQQANERISSTKQETEVDKDKEKEAAVAGKKRRKREKPDEDSESSNSNDDGFNDFNWAQCDSCRKWRIIPNHIKISELPEKWYCRLNPDPLRNTCEAPEQTAKTPVVKRNKKRGRKKRIRAMEAAEAQQQLEEQQKASVPTQAEAAPPPPEPAKERARPRSPLPKEDAKSKESTKQKESAKTKESSKSKEGPKSKEGSKSKDAGKSKESSKLKEGNKSRDSSHNSGASTPRTKLPRASPSSIASAENLPAQDADSEPPMKRAKHEKKTRRLPETPLESIPEAPPTDKVKRGKKSRKEREKESKESAKERDNDHDQAVERSNSQKDQDIDNVEWVQCEKCDKWRKLPSHISADELPEVWFCSMNTWNPQSASCAAAEDSLENQQDVAPATSGGSNLSYRNLIFGSGRKVNRPVSERTRAAESIFAAPAEETGYPTVKYANSSAFAPRGSRANIIEDENNQPSVFDIMHHSSLWAELRGACQPFNSSSSGSAGFGKPFLPKYSFETIPRDMRQDLKDIICQALGSKTLLGEEVVLECQCRQLPNAKASWAEVRAYCTKDTVITLLCELVKEGKVKLVQAFGCDWTVRDWNPRYRLVDSSKENAEPDAAPPVALKSRCLKMSKPWKRNV